MNGTPQTPSAQEILHDAIALFNHGDFAQSITLCVKALNQNPDLSDGWNIAGLNMLSLGHTQKAIEYLLEACKHGKEVGHFINLAEAYRRHKNPQESIKILEALIDDGKIDETILFNLGKSYTDTGDIPRAIAIYRELIRFNPKDGDSLFCLANLLESTDTAEALELYKRAYEEGHKSSGRNLASLYASRDELLAESLKLHEALLQKDPKNADVWFNYANALSYAGESLKAEEAYKKAIALADKNPSYKINLAYLKLRKKHFQEGFALYEARRELEGMNPNVPTEKLYKLGDELKGKRIFLYHEQGLGDTIMFERFITQLSTVAKEILFIAQQPLQSLFSMKTYGGNLKLIHTLPKPNAYDLALPLPSLPAALGLETIPARPKRTEKKKLKRVGFVYKSNPAFEQSGAKSIDPQRLLEALGSLPLELVSLQVEGIDKTLQERFKLEDAGSGLKNFADTQKALESVDLLITIDTAIAHLAGDMGLKTYLLLPKRADWRWEEGKISSWYDSIETFRQKKIGGWEEPLEELVVRLKEDLKESS